MNPANEIQPLIGSKEGILHITLAFVNVGEQVLVPNPGYPTYTSLSRLLGADPVPYDLSADNDWQPDFDTLEQMDLSRVKLMWTNYPNMPTGGNARMETYKRLVEFARRHNIVVVNDNPYSFILNEKPISLLQVEGAKDCCIEFNSMSKSHNMPGWRVGMCMANPTFISWILKIKSNIDSGTFRGLQLAAAEALGNEAEWHHEANIETYARRRRYAEQIMDAWLLLRQESGGNVPLGKDTGEVFRLRGTDREGIARGKSVHHSRLHLRQQRTKVYPYLTLCQRERLRRCVAKSEIRIKELKD